MPNQPDSNNRTLSVRVPRELYYKVKREAANRKMDMTSFVRWVLSEETLNIELTADEIKLIAQEVENEERKRNRS